MSDSYDVVIAGGAAHGSSLAYWLTADPAFRGRVLVVEKDPTYARAATSLSLSSIRAQFSCAVNIRVGLAGVAFLKSAKEMLAVDGDGPDLQLRENGYLYLASEAGAEILRANHATQIAQGADVALLVARRDQGALSVSRLGRRRARLAGALGRRLVRQLHSDAGVPPQGDFAGRGSMPHDEVVAVEREGARVTGVRLASGRRIGCGAFVNTAGASGAAKLARGMGVAVPVESRKRCVFVFEATQVHDRFPLLIDPSGVYVRPEGRHYLVGGPPPDPDPDTDDFEVDWPQFEEFLWPALAARIPAFESLKLVRAWAGHYDLNVFDHNAIVGRLPGFDNAYLACGFSGHGVQQAPAIGRGLAELIAHGGYRALDLSDFSLRAYRGGSPVAGAQCDIRFAMSEAAEKLMDVDEFLTWADGREGKWELHDGRVVAMAPEVMRHSPVEIPRGGYPRTTAVARARARPAKPSRRASQCEYRPAAPSFPTPRSCCPPPDPRTWKRRPRSSSSKCSPPPPPHSTTAPSSRAISACRASRITC